MAPRRGGDESAPLRGRPFPYIVPPCTYSSHVKGGVLEVERTKSGKVRRVPLPPALAAEIRTRVARLVPFVHHGQFAQTVKRLSGVVGSHVHRTRHDWAIQWLADGGSLAAAREMLGHLTIETTMRYPRITEDLVEREAERVFKGREGA